MAKARLWLEVRCVNGHATNRGRWDRESGAPVPPRDWCEGSCSKCGGELMVAVMTDPEWMTAERQLEVKGGEEL
jgi:hypothetical protein